VVVYLALFFSLSINYIYSVFLQEIIHDTIGVTMKLFDSLKIEVHFIRYLEMAVFDHRQKDVLHDMNVLIDTLLLVLCCVLFVIALRFWTAPVYLNY